MATALLLELANDPRSLYRHTVDEYEQMIASGALEEGAPFELLDGHLVRKIRGASGEDPMTFGTGHVTLTTRLGDLNPQLKPLGCYIRIQAPVRLPPYDEPEPDGLIVRGTDEDYTQRHPVAADVLCVIEVADASLKRDRGYKLQLYAKAGLPTYIIFNLVDRIVEVYTGPLTGEGRYANEIRLSLAQGLPLPTPSGSPLIVPIATLFP
jgi:Uma2 family endonuclease